MKTAKLSTLVKNELIKLRARKLNTVLAALLIAATLLSLATTALSISLADTQTTAETAQSYIDNANAIANGYSGYSVYFFDYKSSGVPEGLVILESLAYAEALRYADSIGIIDHNDWRYSRFSDEVFSTAFSKVIVDQIENGKEYADFLTGYLRLMNQDYSMHSENARLYDECRQWLDTAKYSDYIAGKLAGFKKEYESFEKQYASIGEPSRAETLSYALNKDLYESVIYACEYIVQNDLDFNDPLSKQANGIFDFYNNHKYEADDIYSESQYASTAMPLSLGGYEQYLSDCEARFDNYHTQLAAGRYCLEHGIYDSSIGNARNAASGFFGNFSLLYIFALIIFSTAIASEFSAKTINMLVIRPVSRARIMQSKFVASVIAVMSVYSVCFAAYTVGSLLITGIGDFFVPVPVSIFGNITAIAYPVYLLFEFLCSCASAIMLGTLAMLMATLTRNAMAGMLIGIASTVFSTVSSLIVSFLFGAKICKFFPLTYTALWEHTDAGLICSSYYGDIFDQLSIVSTSGTSIVYGLIVCILLTALWLYCAISSFKRRDIK